MRLRRLLIEHYGNFDRLDLPLAAEPGCMTVVLAPNGAGKSMLRRAFHDLLFGYRTDSKLNFRFPRGLSLRAEAVTAGGEDLHFGLRHPGGHFYPEPEGAAMAARFGMALGGIKPAQLENLFALDTARLRSGGEELARGGDSLGLALLSGTGELMSAKRARDGLLQQRNDLYEGSRKSSRPLARAASEFSKTRKATRNNVQLPLERTREEAALSAARESLQAARDAHATMRTKQGRLHRIDRTRRFLDEHRTASEWLAANPDAPVLPPGLADELAGARHVASGAGQDLAHAQGERRRAAEDVGAVTLDDAALAQDEALEVLAATLKTVEKAAHDAWRVQGERQRDLDLVAGALRQLGADTPLEDAARLLPRVADETLARRLIAQHASRMEACGLAGRSLVQARDAVARLKQDAAPLPRATGALHALLQAIRADREPNRHASEAAAAARDAEANATAALAAIPGWTGTGTALLAQPAQLETRFARLDESRRDADSSLQERELDRERLAEDRAGWTASLQDVHARPLPDARAIAEARDRRDTGWRLIYRRAFEADPDRDGESRFAGAESLPLAFERALRTADALADQRLAELTRVTEAERLAAELARTSPEWESLGAACEEAQRTAAAAQGVWGAACGELNLDAAASLADVQVALKRRADAAAATIAAERARQEYAAVLDRHAEWANQLRGLLGADASLPFAALLVAADADVKAEAGAREARIRYDSDASNAGRTLRRAEADDADARAASDTWKADWEACLALLGRPRDETPAATEAVLQCLASLDAADREARGRARRIAGMHAEVAAYAATAGALAASLGEPPGADGFATARLLIARHNTAKEQRTLRRAADQAQQARETSLAEAAEADRKAQAALNAIIAACGAADGEQAEQRLNAARERARNEAARDAAAAGLREHGEGLAFAALESDADSVTADEAAREREQIDLALTQAFDASEAAARTVRDLEQRLADAEAATGLAESVRNQEAAAATFSRLLDDYVVLALAEQMLTRAVAEVEAKAGSNGVSRIAAAFARVTNDAYTIEGDDGEAGTTILKAVELAWPGERKLLAQLSEGTRDQLYLALRIVAIEDHAGAAAPLPFLADDILQTFDDNRAMAALQALLDLSAHTQVIVLTHHPHLAALAGRLPPGRVQMAML